MQPPRNPKLYHIVPVDCLPSIIGCGGLLSDVQVSELQLPGTRIGMSHIKARRRVAPLNCHPELCVGECVPFYFCPRSVMLYLLHKGNHEHLDYHHGQDPIVHLETDLRRTVAWANRNHMRWAFTNVNAGSRFFEDYSALSDLHKIDWSAIFADHWQQCKDSKQAEFLLESSCPWELISRIGVKSERVLMSVKRIIAHSFHQPTTAVVPRWYY